MFTAKKCFGELMKTVEANQSVDGCLWDFVLTPDHEKARVLQETAAPYLGLLDAAPSLESELIYKTEGFFGVSCRANIDSYCSIGAHGLLLLSQGRHEEAYPFLFKVAKTAFDIHKAEFDTDRAFFGSLAAACAFKMGDAVKVSESFRVAREEIERSVCQRLTPISQVKMLLQMAKHFHEQQDYGTAEKICSQAIWKSFNLIRLCRLTEDGLREHFLMAGISDREELQAMEKEIADIKKIEGNAERLTSEGYKRHVEAGLIVSAEDNLDRLSRALDAVHEESIGLLAQINEALLIEKRDGSVEDRRAFDSRFGLTKV